VVGLVLVLAASALLLVFNRALLGVRADVAALQGAWPDWLVGGILVGIETVSAIAIVGANLYLLYRRMFRRWMMINVAAFGAILLASVISNGILAIAPSDALRTAVERSAQEGLGNDLLASVVAVLTVSSVWIGPRLRPWIIGFVAAAASLSFIGDSVSVMTLPFDIGVGILAGSLAALALKTRDRTPTATELASSLRRAGIGVARVDRMSVDARASIPWFVTTTSGDELFVKTLGSDQRAADLLFRLYRVIRLRRPGDRRPHSSLRRAVEHEAFLSLASEARDVRTPQLVTVAEVGTDAMLLAYRKIDGRSLDEVDPDRVTDEMLVEIWGLVGRLRAAGIAHRDLRLANIFVADDGVPWIINFGFAELAAEPPLLARDDAELLASTATVVGPERSVTAAIDVLGRDAVAEALPWIQPLALSSATRTQLGKSEAYAQLRAVAAEAVGVDEVTYERIERVKPGTLVVLASVALALYVLIPQFTAAAGFFDELARARLSWVVVAVVASMVTYVGAGVGILGAVPMRLALGPVIAAQLAGSFTNRVSPAKVGGMATNVRFLQKQDLTLPMAASAVGLDTVTGAVVHSALLLVFGVAASRDVGLPIPDAQTAALIVGALILLSGAVMLLPIGRKLLTRYLVPALKAGASSVAAIARTPAKLVTLVFGSAIVTVSYTVAMLASLTAFDVNVPIATAAAVYLAGAAISSAAPTPGGVGATEAALIAGYTAVGVTAATAFAAVLLFRLVTFWLPILPGWLALVGLQRSGRL
jgi:undecaprenyl-diphosphatase